MDAAALWAFASVCLLIEITPGPNMTYLALLAGRRGRIAGYAAVAGVAVGLAALGLMSIFGLTAIVSASPVMWQVLRWGGVGYLIYLAWESWRESPELSPSKRDGGRYFRDGLITNLLNPKAGIFYLTILPTFVPSGQADGWVLGAMLTAIYVVVASLVHATIVTFAGTFQPFLTKPSIVRRLNMIFAIALGIVALWIAWTTR